MQTTETNKKRYEQTAKICCQDNSVILGVFSLLVAKRDEPINTHSGHDLYKIPPRLLKKAKIAIVEPLSILFNKSLIINL